MSLKDSTIGKADRAGGCCMNQEPGIISPETLQGVEGLLSRFYRAVEELNLELSPAEIGKFFRKLTDHWGQTGDLPSKDAIKILLGLEFGEGTALNRPMDLKDSTYEEWPKRQKGQKGKKLLADFLCTPAHLEAMRNFSELWWPFRHRIDGRVLLDFISRGLFPEWYRKPQSHRIRFALKKMEKFVNLVKGRESLFKPKAGEAAQLPPAALGRGILADFLQTPAHLEAVRTYSQLWRPFREVLDGELLMRFIYKGWFPKEYLEATGQEINAA